MFAWLIADVVEQSPARGRLDVEHDIRRRLYPLLDMYPTAIAELQSLNDPATMQLEYELAELNRSVAAASDRRPAGLSVA